MNYELFNKGGGGGGRGRVSVTFGTGVLMSSNFADPNNRKYTRPGSSQNKGEKKKENELVFFRKLTLLKSKIHRCFLLLSLLEPLMRSNLDAYFVGKL